MLKSMGRVAAALLVIATVGCSGASGGNSSMSGAGNKDVQQQSQSGVDKTKAQSNGGSALDQELKRQSNIYKEFLQHNTEQAAKHREADKKMLDGMRKNEQQSRQDELKRLQLREGLISDDEAEQSGQNKQKKNTANDGQGSNSKKDKGGPSSDQSQESTGGGGSSK